MKPARLADRKVPPVHPEEPGPGWLRRGPSIGLHGCDHDRRGQRHNLQLHHQRVVLVAIAT